MELIKPVTVEYRKMDLVSDFFVESVKNRDGWPCTISPALLVVATGEFKFKIK